MSPTSQTRRWRKLLIALLLQAWCALAAAQACGQEGGRPCNVWERIPSCNSGLIESAGKCLQPSPCGGQWQRACRVFERLPSCNNGLVEANGQCVAQTPCGGQGQRACLVVERIPSCDRDLVEVAGKCAKPATCGAPGERACTMAERVPACDSNTVLRNGRCELPYAPQAGPNVVGNAGGRDGAVIKATSRPGAGTNSPVGGGCTPQSFAVREACFNQPPALWVPKGLWGCTYEEAARAIPPSPGCRYIR